MKIDRAGFFERVQEAIGSLSAPEIGRKLNITKHGVYAWQKGTIPEADKLAQIAESNSISLHWLLTGEGPKHVYGQGKQSEQASESDFSEEERQAIQDIAASGSITFNDAVAHIVREWLAMKGIGEMPEMTPVPVYQMIEEALFKSIEEMPSPKRESETMRLIGKLMVRASEQRD